MKRSRFRRSRCGIDQVVDILQRCCVSILFCTGVISFVIRRSVWKVSLQDVGLIRETLSRAVQRGKEIVEVSVCTPVQVNERFECSAPV